MRIGLVFDRPTELCPSHHPVYNAAIGQIEGALCDAGHEVVCIGHAGDLVDRLAAGDRFDLIFNYSINQASGVLVAALAEQYGMPVTFASATALASAHKPEFLQALLRDRGVLVSPPAASQLIVAILGSGSSAQVLGQPGSHQAIWSVAQQTALAAWRVLEGRDAGCVSLAVEADGTAQVVGLQMIPELSAQSPLVTLAAQVGMSLRELISRILDEAQARAVGTGHTLRRPHMLLATNEKSEV